MASRTAAKVAIVGTGRVGTSLARGLYAAGYRIISLINRSGSSALALAKSVKCAHVSTEPRDLRRESEIIIIAVNDGAIASTVRQLLLAPRMDWRRVFAAHCSGMLTSSELRPLEKKGAVVASVHPVQTFPQKRTASSVRAICFGIEGSPAGIARADRLVRDLGSQPVVIAADRKPLYHAACVVASGYFVTLLNALSEITEQLEIRPKWTDLFGPLMMSAMENSIRSSPASALTGPIVRGDLDTVSQHIDALRAFSPRLVPMYLASAVEVARILHDHGRSTPEAYAEAIRRLRKFVSEIQPRSTTKRKK